MSRPGCLHAVGVAAKRAALIAAVFLLASTAAQADTYDFVFTSVTGLVSVFNPETGMIVGVQTVNVPLATGLDYITVAPSQVATGGMNFSLNCEEYGAPPALCPAPWPSYILAGRFGEASTIPNTPFVTGHVGVSFNADGTWSGAFTVTDLDEQLLLHGDEYDWSGFLTSDFIGPCQSGSPGGVCDVTGYWLNAADIPEPSGFALLIGALTMIGFLRARSQSA